MIVRQNALTNAVNFHANIEGLGEIDDIIATAREFEAYTSGDLDREASARVEDAMRDSDTEH